MKHTLCLLTLAAFCSSALVAAELTPTDAAFLNGVWKTPAAPLPGAWTPLAAGKDWKLCEWKTPAPFLGHVPTAAEALFRSGRLVLLKFTLIDVSIRTPEELKRLQAELDVVNNTAPFDRKRSKTLTDQLRKASLLAIHDYYNSKGNLIEPVTKEIEKTLGGLFPYQRYRLVFDTQGREADVSTRFNGRERYGNETVAVILDAEGSSLCLYIYPQPKEASPKVAAASVPSGDAGPEFLSKKVWDGPRSAFPKTTEKAVFGAAPLEIYAGGYYNPDAGGHVDRTSVADVSYLKPFFLLGSRRPFPAAIPKTLALRRQFEKSKDVQEATALLAEEKKMRAQETTQALSAHIEKARQLEVTILGQILNEFPAAPDNASAEIPFRFFRNDDWTSVLVNTGDEIRLEVFRRIEK